MPNDSVPNDSVPNDSVDSAVSDESIADEQPTEPVSAQSSAQSSAKLPVVIVAGFHEAAQTDGLVRSLPSYVQPIIADVFPTDPLAMSEWLQSHFPRPPVRNSANEPAVPIVGIGFSAGVVGLAGGLTLWQQLKGGSVARIIAVDGWGVPLFGIPATRISHDRLTHVSSLPLGAGDVNFYADPAVPHLQLWREPETTRGQEVSGWQLDNGVPMTAAEFLRRQLHAAWNQTFSWRATV